jgi:hypothetical protein
VLPQTVTNVWRTELGTTFLNGLNSTTDVSAYFRHLCLLQCATNHRLAPSSSPVWPRLPGTLLLTKRLCALSVFQGCRLSRHILSVLAFELLSEIEQHFFNPNIGDV